MWYAMTRMYKIITDEQRCRQLWEQFSPHENIHDEWEFRHCFARHVLGSFAFFIVEENDTVVGLIPLWKEEKQYGIFGEYFPEQNRIFLNDRHLLAEFLAACPRPVEICHIRPDQNAGGVLPLEDDAGIRYYLDLTRFPEFEAFLATFSAKHRKNVRRDLRSIEQLQPKTIMNRIEDFPRFCELHVDKFPDSDFRETEYQLAFKELITWASQEGKLPMMSIELDGNVEAVGLSIVHNRVWTFLNNAVSKKRDNLGKYLIAQIITHAIQEQCIEFDAMTFDLSWKTLWNLQQERLLIFEADSPTGPS